MPKTACLFIAFSLAAACLLQAQDGQGAQSGPKPAAGQTGTPTPPEPKPKTPPAKDAKEKPGTVAKANKTTRNSKKTTPPDKTAQPVDTAAGEEQPGAGKTTTPSVPPTTLAEHPRDQDFSLPDFEKLASGHTPDTAGRVKLILALAVILCIAAVIFQGLAFMRLRDIGGPIRLAELDPLRNVLNDGLERANRAAQMYDLAYDAATRPAPAAPPRPSPVPRADPPPRAYVPPAPEPARPVPVAAPPAPGSDLMADYQRVRSSSDRGPAVDWFESTYRTERISCVNFDDLRVNPNATLRFQDAARGWIFVVKQGPQRLAFPWFTTDLNLRERLEGIFQYPPDGRNATRVATPAILEERNTEWVMTSPGVLDG